MSLVARLKERAARLCQSRSDIRHRRVDTAHKLAILTSLAFGTEVDAEAVHVEGIESISLADLEAADELGYRVKLLGVAQRTEAGIEQRVHPTMVRKGNVSAEVDGVLNAVAVDADTMELTPMGPGPAAPRPQPGGRRSD